MKWLLIALALSFSGLALLPSSSDASGSAYDGRHWGTSSHGGTNTTHGAVPSRRATTLRRRLAKSTNPKVEMADQWMFQFVDACTDVPAASSTIAGDLIPELHR